MQTAYATLAARDAISATSGVAAQLSQSHWAIRRKRYTLAFSRSQESDADDFSTIPLKNARINLWLSHGIR